MVATDSGVAKEVAALAALIGGRNFISYAEIKNHLGIDEYRVIQLKPFLETFLSNEPGGLPRTTVTSSYDTNPPGLVIED